MSSRILNRLLAFDKTYAEGLTGLLAGIDEAGRGPLAGPVVAAAVILLRPIRIKSDFAFLNDSKQVSAKTRELLFRKISQYAIVGIGVADENQIDTLNIYQATRVAMKRAVLALSRTPDLLLIDGNMKLDLPLAQRAIVGGDAKSASIAAASIIAKVHRDAWMEHLDKIYPEYQFKNHKGYGTPAHLKKIRQIGPSPVHRKSFAPNALCHSRESGNLGIMDPRLRGDDTLL